MIGLIAAVAVFCLAVGGAVYALNPQRLTNQVFSLISFAVATWLLSVAAVVVRAQHTVAPDEVFLFLLRTNALIAAYFPWAVWLLKESLVEPTMRALLAKSAKWFLACACLSLLAYNESFIFYDGQPAVTQRGISYIIYSVAGIVMYLALIAQAIRQLREQAGVRLMELQCLVLNMGISCLTIVVLTSTGNLFQIQIFKKISVIIFMLSFLLNAWTMYLYNIYEPREIIVALAQRIFISILAALEMVVAWVLLAEKFGYGSALIAGVLVWAFTIFWCDSRTREWLDMDGQKQTATAREIIIAASIDETTASGSVNYASLLARIFHANGARMENTGDGNIDALALGVSPAAFSSLLEMGWVTPESLERRKPSPSLHELGVFMLEREIGAMVVVSPLRMRASLVLTLGRKSNRWPYTYLEVQRLHSLAQLIDNIMAHSRLIEQSALKERLDHVELVARGFAHDLKNLMTPMLTLLQHVDAQFGSDGQKREIFLAAKQSSETMLEYLGDVNSLAAPKNLKFANIKMKLIAERVMQVASVAASRRSIKMICDIAEQLELKADEILIHRMMTNIIVNAMEAVADGGTICISSKLQGVDGVELAVEDNGRGIPVELRDKIFSPYFTTKQVNGSRFGAGIGLAICERVVQLHHGKMRIESRLNGGTRVCVTFPPSLVIGGAMLAMPS